MCGAPVTGTLSPNSSICGDKRASDPTPCLVPPPNDLRGHLSPSFALTVGRWGAKAPRCRWREHPDRGCGVTSPRKEAKPAAVEWQEDALASTSEHHGDTKQWLVGRNFRNEVSTRRGRFEQRSHAAEAERSPRFAPAAHRSELRAEGGCHMTGVGTRSPKTS